MRTIPALCFTELTHVIADIQLLTQIGAGGGTRTRTPLYWPRILSPVRLPFRHSGNIVTTSIYKYIHIGA